MSANTTKLLQHAAEHATLSQLAYVPDLPSFKVADSQYFI